MVDTIRFQRGNLPHWIVADHSYFVTIRLKGSLPAAVVEQFKEERQRYADAGADSEKNDQLRRQQFLKLESLLDGKSAPVRWLDQPEVARVVLDSFQWLRDRGWVLYAATVLSTHVHILLRNEEGSSESLLTDLRAYKNYTAREANRLLGRSGAFWARESFDHWVRNREKFEATLRYIVNNPVKATRVSQWRDWPWTIVDAKVEPMFEQWGM